MEHLSDIVDYGVIGLLIFMSFLSLWFFTERAFFYKSIEVNSYQTKEKLEIALTENLTIIGTVASNAPYIGLLGTVIAIMQTFIHMSTTTVDAGSIMESLALALKTTAIGLGVAILAVVFYNILSRYAERLISTYEKI